MAVAEVVPQIGGSFLTGEGFTPKPVRRGTTNGNARGGSDDRKRRREWLVTTYRANADLSSYEIQPHPWHPPVREQVPMGSGEPACRCYRCGLLLSVDSVTVDRIKPGCEGGTYARTNIRPACAKCNSSTGGTLAKAWAERNES